jgi:hypothetical protein
VTGGRIIALSTPYGNRGWWYEEWRSQRDWQRFEITADEVPRTTEEFLAEERSRKGEWWFRQEYYCEFLDAETQLFTREEVEEMFDDSIEAWAL